MEERILKRGKTSGRTDDNKVAIQKRFRTYVCMCVYAFELESRCCNQDDLSIAGTDTWTPRSPSSITSAKSVGRGARNRVREVHAQSKRPGHFRRG